MMGRGRCLIVRSLSIVLAGLRARSIRHSSLTWLRYKVTSSGTNSWMIAACTSDVRADDWRQFRGSDSSGISTEENLPTKVDDSTLKWKINLPGRGVSGPIVVGNRLFLTASSGYRDDQLRVLCFSIDNGEQLWERKFAATGRTISHESISMATPQPCSDGERVYAYFSSGDVVCLDLDELNSIALHPTDA